MGKRATFADLPVELVAAWAGAAASGHARIACPSLAVAMGLRMRLRYVGTRVKRGESNLKWVNLKWTIEAYAAENGRQWWDLVATVRPDPLAVLKQQQPLEQTL